MFQRKPPVPSGKDVNIVTLRQYIDLLIADNKEALKIVSESNVLANRLTPSDGPDEWDIYHEDRTRIETIVCRGVN